MATYSFDTITPGEALAFAATDVLNFRGGSSTQVTVLYDAGGLTVVFLDRTVYFGQGLQSASVAGGLKFVDGSLLYIGDSNPNEQIYPFGTYRPTAAYGGDGADTITSGFGDAFIQGNAGDDVITAYTARNVIYGGKGNDTISVFRDINGKQPPSYIHGNMGRDTIQGGSGDDTLLGGQDNDHLIGNEGRDYVNGNLGDDVLQGGFDGGQVYGEAGNDTLWGGANVGRHYMSGGDGDDRIFGRGQNGGGGGGDNTLDGGSGHDTLTTDSYGVDLLMGGAGNDSLASYSGGDTIWGGEGQDSLFAGAGKTIMYGEGGADRFKVLSKDISSVTLVDEIRDWTSDDRIAFTTARDVYGYLAPGRYGEATAATYADALAAANGQMQGGGANMVAVQVGGSVVVFADTWADGRADAAIILTGATLDSISSSNLTAF